ncbi:hypothetical protein DENIS_2388 [Desulfonema ishimotonii]|uniref:DUF262 domain-containing protein n=1 Tax=Desulfonema ishimotonii TaxID=45657 RepID=A0A401FWS6_9BACT|nr:hypothetical protein [Desulfonema ishimotonii]GBC61428.1 hypothetical protein DENIS_2388 [Desulfonema ishimotonii]
MDILHDRRVDCYSVLTTMSVREYLSIVEKAYENGGGLKGQREPLKTSTAIRIRKRMVQDLKEGTVLPPIVIGVIVSEDVFGSIENISDKDFKEIISSQNSENISIIDGMQRTTALSDAISDQPDVEEKKLRIEYWIAPNTNSLIYRMLVLNTGQVPWNIRRQIEVVFRSMIEEIKVKAPSIELLDLKKKGRRSKAGQFQADDIIELFLVFGTRKEKVDIKEKLADEFTRLDVAEATSDPEFTQIFYEALDYLGKFDAAFAKYSPKEPTKERFKSGKDLFASQPVRVGFITAIALEVFGRPGKSYTHQESRQKWDKIKTNANNLLSHLESINNDEIESFLDYTTLNEVIVKDKISKHGNIEREFFLKAFKAMVEEKFVLKSMTPCWRAY